mmetsp:Transcript_45605/g.89742  ORF Transcript_45605/g.89742 Transcript_45605/m.89742 type:complete len:249 (+) Transcript_45605:35-781(+)
MSLQPGEYNGIQTTPDSPEISLILARNNKFKFVSASSYSKGFYEYFVEIRAKGSYSFDETGSFVACTAFRAESVAWNTEKADRGEESSLLPSWTRMFAVSTLTDPQKFMYRALPPARPPSAARTSPVNSGRRRSNKVAEPSPESSGTAGQAADIGLDPTSRRNSSSSSSSSAKSSIISADAVQLCSDLVAVAAAVTASPLFPPTRSALEEECQLGLDLSVGFVTLHPAVAAAAAAAAATAAGANKLCG